MTSALEISVVVVTHGAWEWTRRCLAALAANTSLAAEVVVVDNASPDGSPERVRAEFPAVRVELNRDNRGFGPASNQGAALARAPVLIFLNSDAIVEPGWCEPLLAELARPGVGAIVPRLLHLDGRLQSAGAGLARDGTVVSFGDGEDADDPAWSFTRTVDFGAAACMAVRGDAFAAAGGFDDVYAPAYYEDADLCLKLAAAGLRTRYVPVSSVQHARFASGSEEAAHALAERNRAVFARRWAEALAGRPATLARPAPGTVLAARDAPAPRRVLVVDAHAAARDALEECPEARVTLLRAASRDGSHDAELRAAGVEVAAPPSPQAWLEARRRHYDVVLAGDDDAAIRDAVRDSQPQAAVLSATRPRAEWARMMEAGPEDLERRIAVLRADLADAGAERDQAVRDAESNAREAAAQRERAERAESEAVAQRDRAERAEREAALQLRRAEDIARAFRDPRRLARALGGALLHRR